MLVIISPRSDREATAGTLFQFIVYRNKKGKTRDGSFMKLATVPGIAACLDPSIK